MGRGRGKGGAEGRDQTSIYSTNSTNNWLGEVQEGGGKDQTSINSTNSTNNREGRSGEGGARGGDQTSIYSTNSTNNWKGEGEEGGGGRIKLLLIRKGERGKDIDKKEKNGTRGTSTQK